MELIENNSNRSCTVLSRHQTVLGKLAWGGVLQQIDGAPFSLHGSVDHWSSDHGVVVRPLYSQSGAFLMHPKATTG